MKTTIPRRALLAAIPFALSGCISFNNNKLAKPDNARPAVVLNLNATPGVGGPAISSPAEASVQSVIVYRGPGSWKSEAYWDEYVVHLTNRGTTPLVIETATLEDFQGNANPPYDDPWTLETESLTSWQKLKSSQTGGRLALGAGAVGTAGTLAIAPLAADVSRPPATTASTALAGTAAATLLAAPIYAGTASMASIATGGFLGSATAASTALAGAATATLVAAPIYLVTVMAINSNNKSKVRAEFERRRLPLPLTLAPGETAKGSLFFRLTPAPVHLTLRGRSDRNTCELIVDLTPLSGLHLKPATPILTAQNPSSSRP